MASVSSGINPLFLSVTALFSKLWEEASLEVGALTLASEREIKEQLNRRVNALLGPLIEDYFKQGIAETNQIMSSKISRLADDIGLPFKYNKDLLLTYNDKYSVFTGYYDKVQKNVFKRQEIARIEKLVLRGKYAGWSDRELQAQIRNAVKTTKNRALAIARAETSRLNTAAVDIYYQNPKVKREYEKVWFVRDSSARSTHKEYDGQVADKDGFFYGPLGKVKGPPLEYNCRCRVELRKRKEPITV